MHALHDQCRRLVGSALATTAALVFTAGAVGQESGSPQCDQGSVIFANDAVLTRAETTLTTGTLFGDGGSFAAHGADEACDPGKSLGPFEVDTGGTLVLELHGSPAIKPVWSLYNNGVGVSVRFEPKLGSGYGPAQDLASAILGSEQTEAKGGGAWSGPGRITAYVGAPVGSGPLTGSCFEQSYTLTATVEAVEPSVPLVPGMTLRDGDRIDTGNNGRVVISGSVLDLASKTSTVFGGGPTIVRGETADILTGRQADDGMERLRAAMEVARKLQEMGYPAPDKADLNAYRTDTLEGLYAEFAEIDDKCKAAVLSKLYLDAHQDEFTEMTALAVGLEVLAIDKLPNNWKIYQWLAEKALKTSVPILGLASTAENILSVVDVVDKYSSGSGAGWKGRWGLAVYRQAMRENWNATRIASERRTRQDEAASLSKQVTKLVATMEANAAQLEKEYRDRLAEVERDLNLQLRKSMPMRPFRVKRHDASNGLRKTRITAARTITIVLGR